MISLAQCAFAAAPTAAAAIAAAATAAATTAAATAAGLLILLAIAFLSWRVVGGVVGIC